MMHTTIGLDIGKYAVRCAICRIDGQKAEVVQCLQEPITNGELNLALQTISAQISHTKLQIDAIGATLDPTLMLSAHRSLPFNDPRTVEQVLPQFLGDIWTIDDTTQVAFEVGNFVEQKNADDGENKGDSDGPVGGYDVYAIHYPRQPIAELIEDFKGTRIDPHVMLPSTEALAFGLGTVLESVDDCWCLLDIGADISTLYVINNAKIALTRAFKVGSSSIDDDLAATFNISPEDAKNLKEKAGFIAAPGQEIRQYQRFLQTRQIEQWDVDPNVLSQSCLRGLNMLFSSLRQTLLNFVTKNRIEPTTIYLTGNGARLAGFEDYLAQFAGVKCSCNLPFGPKFKQSLNESVFSRKFNAQTENAPVNVEFSLDAVCAANAAACNIDGKCPLNLRRGALAHKGSLAFIQENKWLLAALVVSLIATLIFVSVTKARMVRTEHDRLKTALEQASEEVFGKKLLTYAQIENEINQSKGYDFVPEVTAFTHFVWISNRIHNDLKDVEMDIQSLDIDNQRKIISISGDITGDEGLQKFLQLMEQNDCFPNEIPEPKTNKLKDRIHFNNLRIESHHCAGNGGNNE